MSNYVIIPARLESKRLKHKLLLDETGMTVLQHTYEQACKSQKAHRVIIAVDCDRLYHEAVKFCDDVILTGPAINGTSRVAQVISGGNYNLGDHIVNVQADEPEIPPEYIDLLFRSLAYSNVSIATLAVNMSHPGDSHTVKVVFDCYNMALYFSRAPIPFNSKIGYYHHIGVYAYTTGFLLGHHRIPHSPLEAQENLEQLSFLYDGYKVGVVVVDNPTIGIDTRADYDTFVVRQERELTI